MIIKFKLFESPDFSKVDDSEGDAELYYYSVDAISFGYVDGKLIASEKGSKSL